jgi:hypothetical protein
MGQHLVKRAVAQKGVHFTNDGGGGGHNVEDM